MQSMLKKLTIVTLYILFIFMAPAFLRLTEVSYISYDKPRATETFEFLQRDVVRMITARSSEGEAVGTGFYISKGILVTAAHVVARVGVGGSATVIETVNYTGISGQVIAIDSVLDLALIRVSNDYTINTKALLGIIELDVPAAGQTLYSAGYAHGDVFHVSKGESIGWAVNPVDPKALLLGTKGSLVSGMSGGPTFGKNGKIVGVNVIGMSSITLTKLYPDYYGGVAPASGIYNIACIQVRICK